MPLIKNLEFDPGSQHLRMGHVEFGTKSHIITPLTRDAVREGIKNLLHPQIASVAVEIKGRPDERLGFDVVTAAQNNWLATWFLLDLPMKAMQEAGIRLDQLQEPDQLRLASNDPEDEPFIDYVDLTVRDELWSQSDAILETGEPNREAEIAPQLDFRPVQAQVVVPRVRPNLGYA